MADDEEMPDLPTALQFSEVEQEMFHVLRSHYFAEPEVDLSAGPAVREMEAYRRLAWERRRDFLVAELGERLVRKGMSPFLDWLRPAPF